MKIIDIAAVDLLPIEGLDDLLAPFKRQVFYSENDVYGAVNRAMVTFKDDNYLHDLVRDFPVLYTGPLNPAWTLFVPPKFREYYAVYVIGKTPNGQTIKGTFYFIELETDQYN